MANWYDIPAGNDRTAEHNRLAYEAYYRTFFGDGRGREVLCDMIRRMMEAKIDIGKLTPELAVANLFLKAFMDETLDLAGVPGGMQLVKAMGNVARSNQPEKKEESRLPEGYTE